MQKGKLLLADLPLKQLFLLFDADEAITILALGDVMHPASGYVDAAVVADIKLLGELLVHPYDFEGLVYFKAIIQNALITYTLEQYEIEGDVKTLAKIENRIRENNCLPGKPQFVILRTW